MTFGVEQKKPKIPKLPKSLKALEKLAKNKFIVLSESGPVAADGRGPYHPGGVAVSNVDLQCPFCGMKFKAVQKSGCFSYNLSPDTCPNCNFPVNVLKAGVDAAKAKP